MGFGLFLNSWISLISSAIDSLAFLFSLVTALAYPFLRGSQRLLYWRREHFLFCQALRKRERELSGRLYKMRKGGPSLFLWAERPFLMLV